MEYEHFAGHVPDGVSHESIDAVRWLKKRCGSVFFLNPFFSSCLFSPSSDFGETSRRDKRMYSWFNSRR